MTITEQYREILKDLALGTKMTRQEIVKLLQDKYGTNPSSILPSDYSYNMTNKGIEDLDNKPNFFLNRGNGQYEYVGENYTGIDITAIISAYKSDFQKVDAEERYKWEAIGWYKKHWDIEASDFSRMLSVSFSKAANLLTSGMYYAYKMLCEYAESDPEAVRELFRELYDESIPLGKRYSDFREGFRLHCEHLKGEAGQGKALSHFQDLHAVSVYLTFEYPGKYYFYKAKVYEAFKNLIGFAEKRGKAKSEVWKIENCNQMCSQVWNYVKQDKELMAMSAARLTEECFQDEDGYVTAMDVVYYGSRMKPRTETKEKEEEGIGEAAYWPSPDEYDPGITPGVWLEALNDSDVTTKENLVMLKMFIEQGGESTCRHLADVYGKVHNYYNKLGSSFCEKIKKKYNCPDCIDDVGFRYYPIAFRGRSVIENGRKRYSWKLRKELKAALEKMDLSEIDIDNTEDQTTDVAKNTILYGPPGTGKTYSTVVYAVAIIEKKLLEDVKEENYDDVLARYNQYKTDGNIETTTFHQSYGYEEFIEGIRPNMDESDEENKEEVQYQIASGLFKSFCDRALRPVIKKAADAGLNTSPVVWKVSLEGTYDNPTRTECLENGHIRLGYDDYGPDITGETDFTDGGKTVVNAFINKMRVGDIVLSCYSSTTIDAVGVITGDYEWHEEYDKYKRLRKVDWLVKGIREDITEVNGGTTMTLSAVYKMSVSLADVMGIVNKHTGAANKIGPNGNNYVFVIDEINRGNISKIFGELITLIEDSKRIGQPEETTVKLPYSKKPFGVPDNVYLVGTMNTADRSIATIDTALRRRFQFKEMQPDADVLEGISVEDVSVKDMLIRMNRRIRVLYDREHTIGHAYFMPLKKSPTIEVLAEIFADSIIPLLQEYFYEDYEKIRLILGDNNKQDPGIQFISAVSIDYSELFGNTDYEFDENNIYEINKEAFMNIESYRSI
ncbi:DUF7225 domain-containing protein [Murimonas intestini]|uniref:Dynein-related subfamily AAA family protein n=1 Tax=Murimonas intestini TaxID=1337051 RepID=A0AB73T6A6_9FIRM|nr:AAA family ATPase [Murimonas intestini]MCR1842103.1 AAA family ATPase [Murimonas intestini]MCR1864841.1 AAA family ATPase [Murimonas intestini]MCR1884168.1 AAA family ATPase [Murimonas intestini]